jgi:hypothetical protein
MRPGFNRGSARAAQTVGLGWNKSQGPKAVNYQIWNRISLSGLVSVTFFDPAKSRHA